jgi:hypothetical protein
MSKNHPLGDAPIEDKYRDMMNGIAGVLDDALNEGKRGHNRKVGFVLLLFPYNEPIEDGRKRCNFISNGADRKDVVALFKEMIARFEGQPEIEGHA